MRIRHVLGLIVLWICSSGCASIFKGDVESVHFTSTPSGARIVIDGMIKGRTPAHVNLNSDSPHVVEYVLDGHRPARMVLGNHIDEFWIVMDVLALLPTLGIPVALITDSVNEDWYTLDMHVVHMTLEKTSGGRAAP